MAALQPRENLSAQSSSRQDFEIRICTHKTCRKQGSQQVLRFLEDAGVEGIQVVGSGCLGRCGNGPNILLTQLPTPSSSSSGQIAISSTQSLSSPSSSSSDDPSSAASISSREPILLGHVATPNDALEVLRGACGVPVSEQDLAAMQARLRGNDLAYQGKLEDAVKTYTSGLDLQPRYGRHLLLCNRSAAHLQLGRKQEALEDALAAAEAGPSFPKAWVRLVDSQYALGQYAEAAASCRQGMKLSQGFRELPEFKGIVQALKAKGHDVLTNK